MTEAIREALSGLQTKTTGNGTWLPGSKVIVVDHITVRRELTKLAYLGTTPFANRKLFCPPEASILYFHGEIIKSITGKTDTYEVRVTYVDAISRILYPDVAVGQIYSIHDLYIYDDVPAKARMVIPKVIHCDRVDTTNNGWFTAEVRFLMNNLLITEGCADNLKKDTCYNDWIIYVPTMGTFFYHANQTDPDSTYWRGKLTEAGVAEFCNIMSHIEAVVCCYHSMIKTWNGNALQTSESILDNLSDDTLHARWNGIGDLGLDDLSDCDLLVEFAEIPLSFADFLVIRDLFVTEFPIRRNGKSPFERMANYMGQHASSLHIWQDVLEYANASDTDNGVVKTFVNDGGNLKEADEVNDELQQKIDKALSEALSLSVEENETASDDPNLETDVPDQVDYFPLI